MSATNAWKCDVCGHVHAGPGPPDECPVRAAGKDMFEPVEEEQAADRRDPFASASPGWPLKSLAGGSSVRFVTLAGADREQQMNRGVGHLEISMHSGGRC